MKMNEIIDLIERAVGSGYSIKHASDRGSVSVFMAEAKEDDVIPSAIAIAVDTNTYKIGTSIISIDEAIKNAK